MDPPFLQMRWESKAPIWVMPAGLPRGRDRKTGALCKRRPEEGGVQYVFKVDQGWGR